MTTRRMSSYSIGNSGTGGSAVRYQASETPGTVVGELWIDSDDEAAFSNSNDYLMVTTASATYAFKTAFQSASPSGSGSGQFWVDSDDNLLYVYNGAGWLSVTPPINAFQLNTKTVSTDYTLDSQYNAVSAGPITINTGITVTIPSDSVWVIV